MARRSVNTVVTFLDPDATPEPMGSVYSVSTHGYVDPDSPNRQAPARLASNVTVEKSIGVVYWNEGSGVDFGNIDINVQDGGKDEIGGTMVDWVEWAKENLNPQVVIAVELTDGTLLHVATAEGQDVWFPNDRTIRISLEAKYARILDQYVNDYVPEDSTYDVEIQGLPIPLWLGAAAPSPPGYDPATFDPRTHMKTLLVDPTIPRYMVSFLGDLSTGSPADYFVLDRGVVLREGESPGFTLWENGFDLTDNPDGEITFIAISEEGGAMEDPYETGADLLGPWRICRWATAKAGVDLADFPSESDFPDLYPANFDETTIPFLAYTGEVTARQVLDDCVLNLNGYWYVDEFGVFQFGKFEAPENLTVDYAYDDSDLLGDISAVPDRAPGLSTRMAYCFSPGAIDINNLAGSITSLGRKNRLSMVWQELTTEATIPTVYETARGHPPMKLYNGGNFTQRTRDEINSRWINLYSGIRRFYTFTIPLRGEQGIPELGDVVTIQSDRTTLFQFGPLPLLVRRVRFNLGQGTVEIEGWGGEVVPPPDPPPAPDLSGNVVNDTTTELEWTVPSV